MKSKNSLLRLLAMVPALCGWTELAYPQDASDPQEIEEEPRKAESFDPLPPILLRFPTQPTSAKTASVTGRLDGAMQGRRVRISAATGPLAVTPMQVRVVDLMFTAEVPLKPDSVNTLFFRTVNRVGVSPPATLQITQDSTSPELVILFPLEGTSTTDLSTNVCGSVGDVLSGFEGLTVTVNGVPAQLETGVGTLATFFAQNVPLTPDAITVLTATATDAAGNQSTDQVTVTQASITPGDPYLQLVSGGDQAAPIESQLASPIVVRAIKNDSDPMNLEIFSNKIVDFRVVRSNGLVSATPGGVSRRRIQVRTDADGFAQVYWTTGSDAGSGNNQLAVSSSGVGQQIGVFASGQALVPRQINISIGDDQEGEVNAVAPSPLEVWVNDGCNGIAGIPVVFTVGQGGGRVNGAIQATVTTGADGKAAVSLQLGPEPGNNRITATYTGNHTPPAVFDVYAMERDPLQPTSFTGVVADNAGRRIGGASCLLTVEGVALPEVFTDAQGQYGFVDIPDGAAVFHVDGAVATTLDGNSIPAGETFPALEYELFVSPNVVNRLPREVLLPPLETSNQRTYSTTFDTILEVDGIEGLQMIVTAGSMTIHGLPAADGTVMALNQVHHDDVPMPMPDGAAPPFAWTLQPAGAHFDPPVRIVYPNMSGLPPGTASFFFSFNHDTGEFEVAAPGQVSDDGLSIATLPGTGLTIAGWGCNCPPYAVTGSCDAPPMCMVRRPVQGDPAGALLSEADAPREGGDRDVDPSLTDPDVKDPGYAGRSIVVPSAGGAKGPMDGSSSSGGPDSAGLVIRADEDPCLNADIPMPFGVPPGSPPDSEPCPQDSCCGNVPSGFGSNPTPGGPQDDSPITDPVYLFSGEFHTEVEDIRIRGRGFDFVWKRRYRSKIPLEAIAEMEGDSYSSVQGYGWDFGYNLLVERADPSVLPGVDSIWLYNGRGRRDLFRDEPFDEPDPNTAGIRVYGREGYLAEMQETSPGVLRLVYADKTVWEFRSLSEPVAPGRISRIADRNGNAMTFEYDGSGRLSTIHDTLDDPSLHNRDVTIAYDIDGRISAITDFTGRTWVYEYYDGGTVGGNLGDLRAVMTPAVTTAHSPFPTGKRTEYRYLTPADTPGPDELHNLVSITDPRGNEFVTNMYDGNDRVATQIWGDASDQIDITYVDLVPDTSNFFVYRKAIVNDRNGNVSEHCFLGNNFEHMTREYTGRWQADQPTSELELSTPDFPKLRPSDPDYFETRYFPDPVIVFPDRFFTSNGQVRSVIHANGSRSGFGYDVPRDFPFVEEPEPLNQRSRGNLKVTGRSFLPSSGLSADQPLLFTFHEYDTGLGGSCCGGFNFETLRTDEANGSLFPEHRIFDPDSGDLLTVIHRDPRIVEDFTYNASGQRTSHTHPDNGRGHRRLDSYSYYESGPQAGYLESQIIDVGGFELQTTYEYDAVGNLTRTIDPRGNDTLYTYNELDQIVREQSRTEDGVRYEKLYYYDANDNLVRVDVQNRDENGLLRTNQSLTTIYEYEILNNRAAEFREKARDDQNVDILQSELDGSSLPLADFVVTRYAYDANRNLIRTEYGEASNGNQLANTLTTEYDERDLVFRRIRASGDPAQSTTQYDYDGNRNLTRVSEGLEGVVQVTSYEYDAYDRRVREVDPMGNETRTSYDPKGNPILIQRYGEALDVLGAAGNQLLSETRYTYDVMDRLIREDRSFFDDLGAPIGDGRAVTTWAYSDNSQVTRVTNDNGNSSITDYDTANRVERRIDAKGNEVVYGYDANSNVIQRTEIELSDLGLGTQTFVTMQAYDALDRMAQVTDSSGNVQRFEYDARGNRSFSEDALGNLVRFEYDGLDRLVSTTRELTDDGTGSGMPAGSIVTAQEWDDTSRLTAQIDDTGNRTEYAYDALDRLIQTTYADGTSGQVLAYDVHDNAELTRDANGSQVTSAFDRLDRVLSKAVARAVGVGGTTAESYTYDGLSRLRSASDDDSLVTRQYDSLDHVVSETLNGQTTACVFDGVGNMLSCTYPGGRTITCTYDDLERKSTISDAGGMIAQYFYVGPDRVERRDYGNGTHCEYEYDGFGSNPAGDFGVKKLVRTTHRVTGTGTPIDDRSYTWDPQQNKTSLVNHVDGETRDYTYDSVYRLIRSERTPMGGPTDTIDYVLDGVGNRTEVIGGANPGVYTLDATSPPADLQMNQYTAIPANEDRLYDLNGNLIARDDPVTQPPMATITYDYRNQMIAYVDATANLDAVYSYDALGRRISKTVTSGMATDVTLFFYADWQVVEEQELGNSTEATFVYGRFVDEVLHMSRQGTDYFHHADDLYSVLVVTNAFAQTSESYVFDDYGETSTFDSMGSPISSTIIENPYAFVGRRLDLETDLYYFRSRYQDPLGGRFTCRDSIGQWTDANNFGNAYSYVGNNPLTGLDPLGREASVPFRQPVGPQYVLKCKRAINGSGPPGFPYHVFLVVNGHTVGYVVNVWGSVPCAMPDNTSERYDRESLEKGTAECSPLSVDSRSLLTCICLGGQDWQYWPFDCFAGPKCGNCWTWADAMVSCARQLDKYNESCGPKACPGDGYK